MSKCIGCGVNLQNTDRDNIGYVDELNKKICLRCFRLKNYGEYKSVTLNNHDYQSIINGIPKDALVIYVVDMMYLNINNIPQFSNMMLVLTKRDLLPKSVKDEKIINKIKKYRDDFLDVICVSSNSNYNIDRLFNSILKHSKNRDVYVVGNTNSGKSTLLNKLIYNYGSLDSNNITVSMYPSTTLDRVEIKIDNVKIIDTPGLIEEGSFVNVMDSKDLKVVTPKKEIKPRSCQVSGHGSVLVGEYVRVDYNTYLDNSFVVYVSNNVKTSFISGKNNTLREYKPVKYSFSKKDLIIPGIGFIKFTGDIQIEVYVRDDIKLLVRDNLI